MGLEHNLEDWHDEIETEEEALVPDIVIDEQYAVHYEKDDSGGRPQNKKKDPTISTKFTVPSSVTDEIFLENARKLNELQEVS